MFKNSELGKATWKMWKRQDLDPENHSRKNISVYPAVEKYLTLGSLDSGNLEGETKIRKDNPTRAESSKGGKPA